MTPEEFIAQWNDDTPYVEVRTSGSTGEPKNMLVEKKRMRVSALTTCSFLNLKKGDSALLCMPVDFIAGKMMIVRAVTCGLNLDIVAPSGHPLSTTPPKSYDLVAMVPLQVYNTLSVPQEREKLRMVRNLIIGGGAVDATLAERLKEMPGAVWSSYGMTETLSHIALRRINGMEAPDFYTPFPGISVSLDDNSCLVIDAPGICTERIVTNDIAEFAPDGRSFRIVGRRDNVICSGGLKIQIEDVERRLAGAMPFPFMITWRPDKKFGQTVVMLMENGDETTAKKACAESLAKHETPRIYINVEKLPQTPTGKPARKIAADMAEKLSGNHCLRKSLRQDPDSST